MFKFFCNDILKNELKYFLFVLFKGDEMKKLIIFFTLFILSGIQVLADETADVKAFFNKYVNAANTYSQTIPDFYSPNAKIIRQVVKPDGSLVNVNTDTATYMKQLKLGQATAKLRKYKNTYRNVSVTKVSNGYKISAERQPTGETYWLKIYQIVQKQPNGQWKVIEELMQTKEQIFLKYAK